MFQSAVLTVAAFDAVTQRSWPPNYKLKQMLGEEKVLLLHNEGAVLWSGTRACRLSQTPKNSWREIHTTHDVCQHQNEISDGVKNRQEEKWIAPYEKENISCWCARSRLCRKILEIKVKWEYLHGFYFGEIKSKSHRHQSQADQQTQGRIYVYDPALPPRPFLYTETCAYPADHTLPHLICLKARSCVYHSPSCS